VADDSNYIGATSADEPLTVDQGTTDTATEIHLADESVSSGTVIPGSTVHDKATVTGSPAAFAPTGDVTFTFFTGGDCTTGTPAGAGTVALDANGVAHPSNSEGPLSEGSYAFQATYAGNNDYAGSTSPCEPLRARTFGKTMGFYGNTNGQAFLLAHNAFTTNVVTLGLPNVDSTHKRCNVTVDSASKSKQILPNTLNGQTLIPQCDTTAERDSGINTNSFNVLLAQTLALSYNNLYKTGFAGQTIGGMGCTAFAPLTSASTTQAVQDYANYLIGNAISNNGSAVITQTMIGNMNTLLGCMNAEA